MPQTKVDQKPCAPIDWRQLSHELRTPLNAILGNAELLLDGSAGPLSAQARASVGEVQIAGRQLLRQVQLLLAWSELSARRPQLSHCRIDLIALIRETSTTERPKPSPVQPQDASLLIHGDPFWLQMLIAEIIALGGAPRAVPIVTLESDADHRALGFAWSDLGAARTAPLQIALIDAIARLQGAAMTLNSDGLTLHWPVEPRDRAEAAPSAPERARRAGAAS